FHSSFPWLPLSAPKKRFSPVVPKEVSPTIMDPELPGRISFTSSGPGSPARTGAAVSGKRRGSSLGFIFAKDWYDNITMSIQHLLCKYQHHDTRGNVTNRRELRH